MMKFKYLMLALLFALNIQAQQTFETIDSLGNRILEYTNTTGAYLSIIKNDSVIYSHAFGYRNKETKQTFDKETVFPISSNTKAFTGVMLSQLSESGKLDLKVPIKEYLHSVEFCDSFVTSHVTTMDLLTHRTGLPRYDFAYISVIPDENVNANKIIFDRLKYMHLTSDFRTKWQYSNINYIVAAHLYESITNEKWESALSEHILKPLSMNSTHCNYHKFVNSDNISQGYKNSEKNNVGYDIGIYTASGMGNMFSTISDLEKWCGFLINGNDSILRRKYLNNTQKGKMCIGYEEPFAGFSNMEYGMGWFIFDYWGHKVVMHHGDNSGHQTMIVLLPDDDISWIIVANETPNKCGFPFLMYFSLLDIFTNNELNDWSERIPNRDYEYIRYPDSLSDNSLEPTLKIKNYCGEYVNDEFGSITIKEVGNKLIAEMGTFSAEIKHWKADSFRMYLKLFGEDYIIHFKVDENKEAISLTTDLVEINVDMLEFKKKAITRANK